MKKFRKYNWLILVGLLMSCQNFLEPKSQSEYVPKLIASLDELLLGDVYVSADDYINLHTVLGLFDDDVAARPVFPEIDQSFMGNFDQVKLTFTWSKDMITSFSGYNIYQTLYTRIMGANAVMDYLDDVSGSVAEKAKVKAQALALRAYYYWFLVNLYGKPYSTDKQALGVPLKLSSYLEKNDIPRNTVEEVYDQIVIDLLEAEALFKTLPEAEWDKKDRRVNLPFVQLFLSRVYLYMENWEQALAYGEKVFGYSYSLLDLNAIPDPSPAKKPDPKPKSNPTSKAEEDALLYPDYFTWDNPEVIFLFGNKSDVIRGPMRQVGHTDYNVDEEGNMTPIHTSVWTVCIVSDDLVQCYEENDLRKSRYLVWEDNQTGVPVYRVPVSKLPVGQGYRIQDVNEGHWGIAFKITEAYLNVAEAAAKIYQLEGDGKCYTKAVDLMNRLREQRFAGGSNYRYVPNSADDLVNFVRAERRREFCFENHRWFDLRRYGMEEIQHIWYTNSQVPEIYTLKKNDPGFTLLIPQSALNKNPGLVQNEMRNN